MAMKMKYTEYASPKQILAIPDHYVAFGYKHAKATAGATGNAVLVDGRYIVKAGTIYPANDATAIGVVLNDYDVTDGDEMMAVVVHGYIKTAALPEVPTANAIGALKQINFVPFTDMGIALTCTKATIAVGEASDTEHEITLEIAGGEFRPAAATLTNWTIAGESTAKVAVQSITVAADGKSVLIKTKNSAAAAAGDVTVKPVASVISTGKTVASAVTIATVA